jgi:antirestriction protein ArdC
MSTVQSTPRRRKEYSEADREAARAAQREQVEQSVRELLTSDGWRRWAETRSTFHDYSFGNCLLIAMQCPTATHIAGFRKWQELGRQVRKGERAIRIMAPMVVGGSKDSRREVRTAGPRMTATSSEKSGGDDGPRMLFRAVPVFDIGQTDGDPLPQAPCEPLTGDSHEHYIGTLETFAAAMGIRVEYRDTGAAGGFYSEREKLIVIASDACPNARVRTLVHELAHAHGVDYKAYSRSEAEVIVETAGTIVCGALGLDTSGEAIPYIAGWGEKGDLDAIRKHAETVDTIARSIEVACGLGRKS